ncbi:histidine phosphatase family protein [Viridibacillus sp. YIM B01967]|uniref:Histidine phosphatase family protein n=1 Tax=Viridibacillus soli TaxID=2798301 RepID=A0ABS1HAH7_9BACL|nr:histidine phosphatase family protein [Viridibacillus soli]MBK3496408.1 histidine phosphatase family protein [Viridibacillus soli]
MKINIYFIRHADSPFIFGQERERPLSEKGKELAEKLVNSLSEIEFDAVFSSPYKRAIQTLDGLIEPSKVVIEEGLRERAIKGQYKLPQNEIDVALWKSFENIDFCLEGGESIREAQNRSLPIILDILGNPKFENVAIGTHGNIMTSILNYFKPSLGYDFWKSTEKPDIYQVTFDGYHLLAIEKRRFNNT